MGGSLEIFIPDWKFQSRRAILNFFNLWALRGPHRTKNTTRSKFITHFFFLTTAPWFTIAAHLVRTPFSWELQTFSFLERENVRGIVNMGAVVKTRSNSLFFYRRSIFGTEGSFGKTIAFAFSLRLRSKTRCFKTRVLGRRLPNGKPQERLWFRALRGKTQAFKKALRSFLGVIKSECRKWGFKRWGFKQIRGYLRKKAFFLRFLNCWGALRALWKRAKKAPFVTPPFAAAQ